MIDVNFYDEFRKIKISELAVLCGFRIVGEMDFVISGVATLKLATGTELSFFGNQKYLEDLKNTGAGAVILTEAYLSHLPNGVIGLVYSNATIGYAKALKVLHPEDSPAPAICPGAHISETAEIGAHCFLGNFVSIGENVKIGDRVTIGANTTIEKGCRIGSGCKICNNVSISHCIMGKDVLVNSGARIGESGFGIIPTGREMIFVKQLGRVMIGDRVRIGANTTIDRGSIEDTVIGSDTIIDNLVQIAHNVVIGERTIVVAQVGIAGSARIGNDVVLAGQVGVVGHLEIGDRVVVAAKSGVASNVDAGEIVGGIPAVDAMTWKRQVAFLKKSVSAKKETK
ncbi:MAG: UDP-3-O-(3-hydroxymyristoyl)glucosamine N-acyltransferase [Holosporaceae bacterium]|jgi:UDP-3-O-[3-hydroxymyristoyl] glucosamine N-acyltransferase|nr:UDP-3-O-(3-hydroxymyristoyl)glucosamine N-acyltransferase [Holosporaceae bacterium]